MAATLSGISSVLVENVLASASAETVNPNTSVTKSVSISAGTLNSNSILRFEVFLNYADNLTANCTITITLTDSGGDKSVSCVAAGSYSGCVQGIMKTGLQYVTFTTDDATGYAPGADTAAIDMPTVSAVKATVAVSNVAGASATFYGFVASIGQV